MRSFWEEGRAFYATLLMPDLMDLTPDNVAHVLSDVARALIDQARDNQGRLQIGGSVDTFAGPVTFSIHEPTQHIEPSPEMPTYEDG